MKVIDSRIQVTLLVSVMIGMALSTTNGQRVSYGPDFGKTTASKADYSVSYGPTTKLPRNYDYYYYGRQYTPAVTYVVPQAPPPPPHVELGPAKEYSDEEYGRMVMALVEENLKDYKPAPSEPRGQNPGLPVDPLPAVATRSTDPKTTGESAMKADTAAGFRSTARRGSADAPSSATAYAMCIADVLDRGILVTSEGLQIRLRGVAFPSINSKHEVRREFAHRALSGLAELVKGKRVYCVVEKPEKDINGRLLAIVHMKDGTELNRVALESGMSIINPSDFADEASADPLISAQAEAVKAKRGIWSLF